MGIGGAILYSLMVSSIRGILRVGVNVGDSLLRMKMMRSQTALHLLTRRGQGRITQCPTPGSSPDWSRRVVSMTEQPQQ